MSHVHGGIRVSGGNFLARVFTRIRNRMHGVRVLIEGRVSAGARVLVVVDIRDGGARVSDGG